MPKLNARLIARLWDFCAPDKPAKWENVRYTYLHDPYVVDGMIMATDTFKALIIDQDTGLATGAHLPRELRSIRYGKRDEIVFDSGLACHGSIALEVPCYTDQKRVPDVRRLFNDFMRADHDTRIDPSLLMPFLRLGKELGWDVELVSNGAQSLVKYYDRRVPAPVRGLIMGKYK